MDAGPLWRQLLIQVILILINAFFAATEIAVVSLNDNKIKRLAEEGDKKAKKLLPLIESPTNFLSTIQIGITLAGFLGSAFAADSFADSLAPWIAHLFGMPEKSMRTVSVVIITIILSYFTLVLGELVPKRIAMKYSEGIAYGASGVVRALSVVLRPVIWFISASTNIVARIFGVKPGEESEEVTEEEIRMMVDIGEEKGSIETTEKEMIENIFEFNNSTAADLMVHRTDMTALSIEEIEESPEDVVATIVESGLSRFPVYEEDVDDIIGILSARKFLLNIRSSEPVSVKEIIYPPYFVPESVKADVLLRDMQTKKIHMAIVLDEFGGTSGLVTMEDLLEEIVGNIYDEFDTEDAKDIEKIGENVWRVAGGLDLTAFGDEIGVSFDREDEEETFTTLGGLIFSCFSEIPQDGTCPEVDYRNLHIKVTEITDRRVEWAEVTKFDIPDDEDDEDNEKEKKSIFKSSDDKE